MDPALCSWVLIPCSRTKRPGTHPVDVLYGVSPHFRLAWRAALRLVTRELPDGRGELVEYHRIRILSAKHGLLAPTAVITDYDCTLGDPDAITVEQLREQRLSIRTDLHPASKFRPERALSLLPNRYHRLFVEAFPDFDVEQLLAGCRGIGDQRAQLSRLAQQQSLPETVRPAS